MFQTQPPEDLPQERLILRDLGFCGHYLHYNFGGRPGQSHSLVMLHKRGGEMPQGGLQSLFEIKSGSFSEAMSKLEAEGLVERTRSDEDHRKMVVRLTPEGLDRAKASIERHMEFEGEAFAPLSPDERAKLLELLEKTASHWKELECRN